MADRVLLGALVALSVSTSSIAVELKQFDLNCSGTEKLDSRDPGRPYSVKYRIDLASMKFCGEDCGTIKDVTPDRITFAEEETEIGHNKQVRYHWVSRTDGALTDYEAAAPFYHVRNAHCEVAPFSGFPETKF